MAIFTMITKAKKEVLQYDLCFLYLIKFSNYPNFQIKTLFNLKNKLNAIYTNLALKLDLCVRKTNINTQKINRSYLNTFNMLIARFLAETKLEKIRFFQQTF